MKRQVKISTGRSAAYSAGESAGEDSAVASVSASFQGVIDLFAGPAVAFSVGRRLNSAYTGPLIRIRRSSDNAEEDIPYIDSTTAVLNEARINDFTGGTGDAFITTVYDQSGNGRNWTQATATLQPRIVESGAIVRMGPNNRPGIGLTIPTTATASTANLRLDTASFALGSDKISMFVARKREFVTFTAAYQVVIGQGNVFSAVRTWHYEESDNFNSNWRPNGGTIRPAILLGSVTASKMFILCCVANLSTDLRQIRVTTAAGGQTLSSTISLSNTIGTGWSSNILRVGCDADRNNPAYGLVGEAIIYNAATVASASSGVDNNLATFWGTT